MRRPFCKSCGEKADIAEDASGGRSYFCSNQSCKLYLSRFATAKQEQADPVIARLTMYNNDLIYHMIDIDIAGKQLKLIRRQLVSILPIVLEKLLEGHEIRIRKLN